MRMDIARLFLRFFGIPTLAWLGIAAAFTLASDVCAAQGLGTAIDKVSGAVVHYRVIDGYAVVDNVIVGRAVDIETNGLSMPQPLSDSARAFGAAPRSTQKDGYYNGAVQWPEGVVPYVVDPSLPNDEAQAISDAATEYQFYTLVRFVPRSTQPNYILFTSAPSGADYCGLSWIGMQGGEQLIYLTPTCTSILTGDAIHEMMHALGFVHEQQRSDRDSYVTINANCTQLAFVSDIVFKYNTISFGPYDYSSVMHYDRFADSNGCATIIPTHAFQISVPGFPTCSTEEFNGQPDIGQRCGLSAGDAAAINHFYSAPPPTPPQLTPQLLGTLAQTIKKLVTPSGSTGTTPDLNQHGLTGSWYEPATERTGDRGRDISPIRRLDRVRPL